jgi:hypothetical protein
MTRAAIEFAALASFLAALFLWLPAIAVAIHG